MADLLSLDLPSLPGTKKPRKRKPTLAPDQTQQPSLAGTIGSGIGWLASSLDKPGRAVRAAIGLATGSPHAHARELAAILPFSDSAGLTDPEQAVGSRTLLEDAGMLGKNKPGLDFGDVAGFAGDVLTDPFTFANPFGVWTKAGRLGTRALGKAGLAEHVAAVAGPQLGKREAGMVTKLGEALKPLPGEASRLGDIKRAAKGMGVSAKEFRKLRNEPLRAAVGIGLPFMEPAITLGTGKTAQKVARYMDKTGRWLRGTRPVSIAVENFHAPAGGAQSAYGQEFLMPAMHHGGAEAKAGARGFTGEVTSELLNKGGHLADETDAAASELRKIYEGFQQPHADFAPTAQKVEQHLADRLAQAQEWGLKTKNLGKEFLGKYFPRHASQTVKQGRTSKVASAFDTASLERKGSLKGIEGETEQLRQIIRDPAIKSLIENKAGTQSIADYIKQTYGHLMSERVMVRTKLGKRREVSRFKALAKRIEQMTPEQREVGLFGNHPHADLMASDVHSAEALSAAQRLIRSLADDKAMAYAAKTAKTADTVPLGKVLKEADMHLQRSLTKISSLKGNAAPTLDELKALAQTPIPADLAADIARRMKKITGPEAANRLVGMIDSYTNLFKAGVTGMWPAFHVRNLFSGQFQNWLDDMFSPRSVQHAHQTLRGHAADVADIPIIRDELARRGLAQTKEHATDILRELAHKHEVVTHYGHEVGSTVGRQSNRHVGTGLRDIKGEFSGGLGGSRPFRFKDIPKKAIGAHPETSRNPFHVRGTWDRKAKELRSVSAFGPAVAGEDIGHYIETLNRLSPFIHNLRKGMTPGEAARRVLSAQIDYGSKAYTPLERQVLARAAPFYKFSRGVAEHTARQLKNKPGGKLAQTLRAAASAQGRDDTTPDYVAETASIPLGETPEGSKRYLTGFGLMPEDPVSFLGNGVRGGLQELVSRSNPLIKAPIEWASGHSFFQKGPLGGRPLDEMDPLLGRIAANVTGREKPVKLPQGIEFIAANSPLSRALSTVRTITDPRKRASAKDAAVGAANALTGVRFADISPAAQDAVLRERAAAAMKELGAKNYAEVYFSKEQLAEMPPEVRAKALELKGIMDTLAARTKARKKAKAAKAP